MSVNIGLIGDYNPSIEAHQAIPIALQLAAEKILKPVTFRWIGTDTIANNVNVLADCDGVWCVPGSPYADMDGALLAIRFAREDFRPFLGTCGGFQHALVEFARNVLGHAHADHAESSPDAEMPLISRLTCSLVEKSGHVQFEPQSRLSEIYGSSFADEKYHCNYGVNPDFASLLTTSSLQIAARDSDGEIRAVELRGHPFFFATLYQPERSALRNLPHPLIVAFVQAALQTEK